MVFHNLKLTIEYDKNNFKTTLEVDLDGLVKCLTE